MSVLTLNQPGREEFLLGNEAIVRGAIEAGVSVATTYPGTPASEIGDTFAEIAKEAGMYMEYSTNEKVAMEVAAGAAMCGVRAIVSMKHVGVNVASDFLMTLAYSELQAGMVIVAAEDPSCHSSQNEQDNRALYANAGLLVLDASSPAEAKDMVKEGFNLSETFRLLLP